MGPLWQYKSGAASTLANNYSPGDTTIVVQSGDGAKFASLSAGQFSFIWIGGVIRKATAISGDTITLASGAFANTTDTGSPSNTYCAEIICQEAVEQLKLDVLASVTSTIGVSIDAGGSVISTGVKSFISVPFDCVISGWDIVADVVGSISIAVYKRAGGVPTTGDLISASSPIALSSAQVMQGGATTGWTTSVAAGDIISFGVTSASVITKAIATLVVTRN